MSYINRPIKIADKDADQDKDDSRLKNRLLDFENEGGAARGAICGNV